MRAMWNKIIDIRGLYAVRVSDGAGIGFLLQPKCWGGKQGAIGSPMLMALVADETQGLALIEHVRYKGIVSPGVKLEALPFGEAMEELRGLNILPDAQPSLWRGLGALEVIMPGDVIFNHETNRYEFLGHVMGNVGKLCSTGWVESVLRLKWYNGLLNFKALEVGYGG